MNKSYVSTMSDVVTKCSLKWAHGNKRYLCDNDSNWFTNMYLDYSNNYVSQDTFIECEIYPVVECKTDVDEHYMRTAIESLMGLFCAVSQCQPMLSYERVGEICIRILKGEV